MDERVNRKRGAAGNISANSASNAVRNEAGKWPKIHTNSATPYKLLISASWSILLALLLSNCAPENVQAAGNRVTPSTWLEMIERAQPGDTLTLEPGDYVASAIKGRRWNPPIQIDARQASFSNPSGYALHLVNTWGLRIAGGTFSNAKRGLVVQDGGDIWISKALFTDLQTDGIDIAGTAGMVVDSIACRNFSPRPGDHPDCVQMWSRPNHITRDIAVRNSTANGEMQGFNGFNHVRDGVDDGGFDRITITGNFVSLTYGQGIGLYDCRHCVVTDNRAESLGKAWVQIAAPRCLECIVERNIVGPKPLK